MYQVLARQLEGPADPGPNRVESAAATVAATVGLLAITAGTFPGTMGSAPQARVSQVSGPCAGV
jgi:hypothetical protein